MSRALLVPAEFESWRGDGMTAREIARHAGVSRKTASRWLARARAGWPQPAPRAPRPSWTASHLAAREFARQHGQKQFDGDIPKCGHSGRRYAASNRCAICTQADADRRPRKGRPIEEAARRARDAARKIGHTHYLGAPCRRCGGTERWTCNNTCVACRAANFKSGRYRKNLSLAYLERTKEKRRTPEVRARRTAQMVARYAADPTFRLASRMRAAVHKALRRSQKDKARRSWQTLVGYSVEALREHIERQFVPGMSWENSNRWHVDHILAISSFGPMEAGDESFRACWALTNLRPLWGVDNQRKGARRELLL